MEKVHGNSAWRLMQRNVHIWLYLCISVYIRYISANICVYQSYIRAYIHISVHICAYMFISKNFILMGKTKFLEKKIFGFKSVLKTGGPVRSSKTKNFHVRARNRSRVLPVPCNSPNHSANTAVHFSIWYGTYFSNMFISVYIGVYPGYAIWTDMNEICVCTNLFISVEVI